MLSVVAYVHRILKLANNIRILMDMKADLKSVPLSKHTEGVRCLGLHVQNWQLSENLKTFFSSAKEVINTEEDILYFYLHSKKNGTPKENTQEVVYNGLKNQGATCYLNSALQVLFMTKEFRQAVESSQILSNDQVFYHLQQLFKDLKSDCVSPVNITRSLSIENVCKQQDAVEWFEKILSAVSQDVSQVYEGRWQKTLRCLKRNHDACHEDNNFFSLPLSIDAEHNDVFNVVNGLQAFFKTTRFDEDDWMYCDDCDEKTDTEISFSVQKYPTILNLHLKRFYFDYMTMGYQKNCCPVDIPPTLDYFESCTYDLYGVINHSGVYGSGHYWANIKSSENNNWYSFDDSHVAKIADTDFLERSRTAYMIVYRKRDLSSPQQEETNMKSSPVESLETATAEEMLEEIKNNTASEKQTYTPDNVLTQQIDHSHHSPHLVMPTKMKVSKQRRRSQRSGPYQHNLLKISQSGYRLFYPRSQIPEYEHGVSQVFK
ncbi:ubiquitin carboxyl-terminal hydrolase 47-like isoform X2 [Alosa sapidissima]|uniref:ubiquitin carboxyl-terminal hydrolase 47-like isoform X2 n=1 Tax=Alosa sapidissima TaxID=34773 RepID=UPI001C08FDB3|nr:ubiquitin carboxyl-terminal hydrolase 47-like isoform X2 [Alosa sapidissima]